MREILSDFFVHRHCNGVPACSHFGTIQFHSHRLGVPDGNISMAPNAKQRSLGHANRTYI